MHQSFISVMVPWVRVQIVNACALTVVTLSSLSWGWQSSLKNTHVVNTLIAVLVL